MDSKSGETIQVWPQENRECHDGKDKAGIFVFGMVTTGQEVYEQ
jgi:hypothetical protein